jgi:polyisoprenoid-binding protein YceI
MSRRRNLVIAAAVLAVVAVGAIWFVFFRNDAPEAASLETAVAGLDNENGESGDPETTEPARPLEDLDGAWTLDTTVGSFDDFTSSWIGFRIDEELTLGAVTAVGRSPGVEGTLSLDGTTITDVALTADLSQLTTDDNRRDRAIRSQGLETATFPEGNFRLLEPIMLDSIPEPETPIQVVAVGELTLHGVTNLIEIDLDAQIVDDLIVVVGQAPVVLSDYGMEAPSAPVVVSVEDEGLLEFQLFFRKN